MDSLQIHRILSRDKHTLQFYKGVYPSDQIPILGKKSIIVVNIDDSSKLGSHWVTFYKEKDGELEFFDSYGQPPEFYGKNILKYASAFPTVLWNSKSFQSPTSNVCGAYCVYFCLKRCQGFSMKSIVNSLNHSKKNDFRIYQFVKKRYGVNIIFRK